MTPADIVDTHCHLDFDVFGAERDEVLARARAQGVRWFVTIGSGRETQSAGEAVRLCEAHRDVLATVGVHPHDARIADTAVMDSMKTLAANPRVVAVGEVGLDHHYDHSPRDAQASAFRQFVALAREVRKPLVIHTRSAPAETLDILRSENARDVGGVIHCFSEDAAFARSALDLGFDISFSGIVTFKRSDDLRAVAKIVPRDRLLVETDAPYLAPVPHRGRRNEPAYVAHTAACLAETLGITYERLCEITTDNACRRFGLDRFEYARE